MKAHQLIGWMKDSGSLGKEASAQLDTLTQSFPYFQTAHLLYIKSLHNENSFLYNNQLKVAAAYTTNRKVLYELITKKQAVAKEAVAVVEKIREVAGKEAVAVVEEINEAAGKKRQEADEKSENEKKEIIQPDFPRKRFVKDEDEWESGMMRQLQLLHHWKTSPAEILAKRIEEINAEKEKSLQKEKEKTPSAADEINTLLYVLVEPGNAEDISETDEIISNSNDSENKQDENWEVKVLETESQETSALKNENLQIPEDAISQEIIREAISSSIELEVDDTLPSLEEMGHKNLKEGRGDLGLGAGEKMDQKVQARKEVSAEENIADELTFAEWIRSLNTDTPFEQEPEKQPITDNLLDKFIHDQPRIQQNKTSFFNPVNMAKKSVQDSDEFITETLAKIYVKQGNISKGIRAYQKLSLKFPEKSAYFAALIEELKRTPK